MTTKVAPEGMQPDKDVLDQIEHWKTTPTPKADLEWLHALLEENKPEQPKEPAS